jgi:putative membrane protein
LLLVYRTNASYDRFWEGRKLWCSITSGLIDIVRIVKAWEPTAKAEELVDLCIAYGILLKHRIRRKQNEKKLEPYLKPVEMDVVRYAKIDR